MGQFHHPSKLIYLFRQVKKTMTPPPFSLIIPCGSPTLAGTTEIPRGTQVGSNKDGVEHPLGWSAGR